MKKCLLIILIASVFCLELSACIPDSVGFSTQADIDNFQINYPGCTQIEGKVYISGSDISNLNGLGMITSIGRDLEICNCDNLANLNGLTSLISIGGNIYIRQNSSLQSLTGVENLNSVSGSIIIESNPQLDNLTGLAGMPSANRIVINSNATIVNLTGLTGISVLDNLEIYYNPLLYNLEGLESLDTLKNCTIENNNSLINLGGLTGLDVIGKLWIRNNGAITSLSGIENITTIDDLNLVGNNLLNSLAALSGISYIRSFNLHSNPSLTSLQGLNSLTEIGTLSVSSVSFSDLQGLENLHKLGQLSLVYNSFGITSLNGLQNLTSLGSLNFWNDHALVSLTNFTQLDSINEIYLSYSAMTNFNGLDSIRYIGNLSIQNPIGGSVNLQGLEQLESVGSISLDNVDVTDFTVFQSLTKAGNISISGTDVVDFNGLSNLTSVTGSFSLTNNEQLHDLSGLTNLQSIGSDFVVSFNPELTHINDLSNLDTIRGQLVISYNELLASLSGLDNVDGSSLSLIQIHNNSELSFCNVPAICDFLAEHPNDTSSIYNNKSGCFNRQQVEATCNMGQPVIVAQPIGAVVCENGSISLEVLAQGSPVILYQWQKNNSDIPGATGNILHLTNVSESDEAYYQCAVSNYYGTTLSTNAFIDVKQMPAITGVPDDKYVYFGQDESFEIFATGDQPLNYQWYGPDGLIVYGNSAYLDITNIDSNDVGNYYCAVSNECGLIVSDTIELTAFNPLTIDAGADLAILSGDSTVLNGSYAGGSSYIKIQWSPASYLHNANVINPSTKPLFNSLAFYLTITDTLVGYQTTDEVNVGVLDTDTLGYFSADSDTLYPFPSREICGFISGNNCDGDIIKANYFTDENIAYDIEKVHLRFGYAVKNSIEEELLKIGVWNKNTTTGEPGELIDYRTVNLSQVVDDVANQKITTVLFDPPLNAPKDFFIGVFLPQTPGDSIAIYTNTESSQPGLGWSLTTANEWISYASDPRFLLKLTNAIFPVVKQNNLGVEEVIYSHQINIFPNPASDYIVVAVKDAEPNSVLNIIDLRGNKIITTTILNDRTILFTGKLTPGLYILELMTNAKIYTGKLLKQ